MRCRRSRCPASTRRSPSCTQVPQTVLRRWTTRRANERRRTTTWSCTCTRQARRASRSPSRSRTRSFGTIPADVSAVPHFLTCAQSLTGVLLSTEVFKQAAQRQVQWAAQALPTFHALGFYFHLVTPFLTACPIGLYEPQYPGPPIVPTLDNMLEATKVTGCTAIPTVPSFLEVSSQFSLAISCLLMIIHIGMGQIT